MSFLAGLFDAEGSIYFHRKKRWGAFELSIANTDELLVRRAAESLANEGYSTTVRKDKQKPERGVKNGGPYIWRLALWRYSDVTRLLAVLPIKHPEKIRKAKIASQLGWRADQVSRNHVVSEWEALSVEIRNGRDAYIEKARKTAPSAKISSKQA